MQFCMGLLYYISAADAILFRLCIYIHFLHLTFKLHTNYLNQTQKCSAKRNTISRMHRCDINIRLTILYRTNNIINEIGLYRIAKVY